MITLRDIMTQPVVTLSPDVTIREAMTLLSSRHISGAPVVAGTDIVGVITSTDLMAFAAELPGSPVEQLDSPGFTELTARDEQVPDVDLDPPGMFFTDLWDDAGADVSVRFGGASGAEWNVLDEHTVEEAMTHAPVHSLPDDATLAAAAEFMRTHAIHRVLVTEEGSCVGIVTPTDIANAVAAHKLPERTYVVTDDTRFASIPVKLPHRETALGDRLRRSQDAKQES